MNLISGQPSRMRLFMVCILALVVLLPAALPAIEQTAGSLRIELLPSSSSFRLYLRAQPNSEDRPSALQSHDNQRSIPLLYTDDPTTSFFSLLEDGRVYLPARDRDFRPTLVETEDGYPAFMFTSRNLEIRQVFIPRPGRRIAADAFEIRFEIRNASTRARSIAVRYVLDTHLGESMGIHAVMEQSDGTQQIATREIGFEPSRFQAVRTTRDSAEPAALGLRIPFTTEAAGTSIITPPEKVLVANWRRIIESGWDYTPVTGRGFSYPPYSRNDSALVLFFPEMNIEPGAEHHISILLEATPSELLLQRRVEPTEEPALEDARAETILALEQSVSAYEDAELDEPQSLQRRLELVDEILAEIDRRLSEPGEFHESELREFEELLQRLE
ncbi:MAG: hypothetical protein EA428_02335 [Spirochaetaceae bacterium]|nr:MAG: hypothetical protein EA428_02335 [Spirochaetaceae bacterium]